MLFPHNVTLRIGVFRSRDRELPYGTVCLRMILKSFYGIKVVFKFYFGFNEYFYLGKLADPTTILFLVLHLQSTWCMYGWG